MSKKDNCVAEKRADEKGDLSVAPTAVCMVVETDVTMADSMVAMMDFHVVVAMAGLMVLRTAVV